MARPLEVHINEGHPEAWKGKGKDDSNLKPNRNLSPDKHSSAPVGKCLDGGQREEKAQDHQKIS